MDGVESEVNGADETEKNESKASTNPVDFQPEIRELIFQHLSGAELLDLSLVSPDWYEKIGKSESFKSSVIIRIDPCNENGHKKPRGGNTDCIKNSKRDYEVIVIRDKRLGRVMEFIGSKAWKHLEMEIKADVDELKYLNLLRMIAPTIEILDVKFPKFTNRRQANKAIEFPHLRDLKAFGLALQPFSGKNPKLNALKFEVEMNTKETKEILLNNDTIERLDIANPEVVRFAQPMPFKLKKLLINADSTNRADWLQPHTIRGWKNFITSQADHLQELVLGSRQPLDHIYEALNPLKKLERLAFYCREWESNEKNPNFPMEFRTDLDMKLNLREIVISRRIETPLNFFKSLLRVTPNLEYLYVNQLTNDIIIVVVAATLSYLKEIKCLKMDRTCLSFLGELKRSGLSLNTNFKITDNCVAYEDKDIPKWSCDDPMNYRGLDPRKIKFTQYMLNQKKLERESFDWYLNPMDLPLHIVERILKSLSHDELLNATLVSKFWNSTIGASLEFRRRIAVSVKERDIFHPLGRESISSHPRDFQGLCNTQRKYQSLIIDTEEFYDDDYLWMRKQKWKEASISIGSGMSMAQYGYFLEALGPAVEVLELEYLRPVNEIGDSTIIRFPALKKLTLTNCEAEALLPFTMLQPKLDYFKWKSQEEGSATSLVGFLGENPTIADLYIRDDEYLDSNVFLHFMATKLAKLTIKIEKMDRASEKMESFRRVIEQNEATMKELTIRYPSKVGILFRIWNHLSRLNYLRLEFTFADEDDSEDESENSRQNRLKPNPNLLYIAMEIYVTSEDSAFSFFKKVLRLTPNVEKLFVRELTREMIEFAARNLMKLKTIHIVDRIEEAEGQYQQMKAEQVGINKNIELKTIIDCNDFVEIVKARMLRKN